jgi:hypothetical protein
MEQKLLILEFYLFIWVFGCLGASFVLLVQPFMVETREVVFSKCAFIECMGFTMEALNVLRNEKYKVNYSIR